MCRCDAGQARTLLGPEKTPGLLVGVVLWSAPGLGSLTRAGVAAGVVAGVRGGGCGVGVWLCVECCIVDASIFERLVWRVPCCCGVGVVRVFVCGQVCKGTWWMSGHQEPMKDVGGRDSPRGVVNRAVIRGCPNGVTRRVS
jgi:hypothetical protein